MHGEVLAALRRLLIRMREDLLQRPVPGHQLGGGLLADARDARQVVAGVADHPAEIGHLRGRHPVALLHLRRVVARGVGDTASRGEHAHVVIHQLQGVAIAREDGHAGALLGRPARQGADDIIGLEALDLHVHRAEGLHERPEVRRLRAEGVGCLATAGLVLRIRLVAERGPRRVPRDDHPRRLLLVDHLDGHRRQPVEGVGGHAVRARDALGESEERPEGEAVAIDEQDLAGGIDGIRAHAGECIRQVSGPRRGMRDGRVSFRRSSTWRTSWQSRQARSSASP